MSIHDRWDEEDDLGWYMVIVIVITFVVRKERKEQEKGILSIENESSVQSTHTHTHMCNRNVSSKVNTSVLGRFCNDFEMIL